MSKAEPNFEHPLIVCNHKLNLSNFDNFANELSTRLNLTIEMHDSSYSYLKTITNENEMGTGRLIIRKSLLIPDIRYELNHEEVLYIIYNDFIEIKFDFEVDYFHLKELTEQNKLESIKFFDSFFNLLKSIGVKELHFGIFNEFMKTTSIKYKWDTIFHELKNNHEYFKIILVK
ncbi:hypothetical protein [Flavobacterium sp.]|uniref:hypothetical protein n=1 Tax=Flavobacterium sp. TaxID=239 RepID=UPI002611E133|nr:hypothetical protein [Flavobacterium sp.]MDD2986793.1 hypothetical protein [Flavobacterium sp.]